MYGNFNADNTTAVAYFNNGHVGHGNVSVTCDSIHWDDGSTWNALVPPPYAVYQVHLCPHTHDDVGWDETYLQVGRVGKTGIRVTHAHASPGISSAAVLLRQWSAVEP